MSIYDQLHSHIKKRISLTNEECRRATTFFTPKNLRKGHFLLQEGDVARHLAFVAKGCLRCYTVDRKGEVHIVQFAIEDWWISDAYSTLTGEPSEYNIDAIEDSELLVLDISVREKLLSEIPKFERLFRLLLEGRFVANQKRITDSLSSSAQERYLNFMKKYPAIARSVPQTQIAAYLGITPQSLSRIRKKLAAKASPSSPRS